jgi:hypothetical protein
MEIDNKTTNRPKIGDKFSYKGDMANQPDFGVILEIKTDKFCTECLVRFSGELVKRDNEWVSIHAFGYDPSDRFRIIKFPKLDEQFMYEGKTYICCKIIKPTKGQATEYVGYIPGDNESGTIAPDREFLAGNAKVI